MTRALPTSTADGRLRTTLPELVGSIGVLEKCGFRRVENASEPGVLRLEIAREEMERRSKEEPS